MSAPTANQVPFHNLALPSHLQFLNTVHNINHLPHPSQTSPPYAPWTPPPSVSAVPATSSSSHLLSPHLPSSGHFAFKDAMFQKLVEIKYLEYTTAVLQKRLVEMREVGQNIDNEMLLHHIRFLRMKAMLAADTYYQQNPQQQSSGSSGGGVGESESEDEETDVDPDEWDDDDDYEDEEMDEGEKDEGYCSQESEEEEESGEESEDEDMWG
ncbi:hypothetical protein DFH27DRAFT_550857 [Peziza echinospora]|nr:hypothetical protein DFH27DRAFT_550857 [Peziza echinospora]